ncbi:MAG TPA: 50S ribosomal protein L35 [Sandaracinaceae bacterium LLY-WYZ-13_1]|nr:50S ribosomal protein L35 [Sandaracinaceae bacterium LLY-WYZ-13_1]
MPKMKTHSGAKKRFRVTGSGRVRRGKAGKSHMMIGKNKRRLRRLRKNDMVDKVDEKYVKRLLAKG